MKALNKNVLFKHKLLCSLVILTMHSAYAGTVRDDIDYQQFRDFAENKGEFTAGETEIQIKDKDGNVVDTLFTDGISMPDWSAVNTRGTFDAEGNSSTYDSSTGIITFHPVTRGHATLINPQYVTGVSHIGTGQHIGFGSIHHIDHADASRNVYTLIKGNEFVGHDKYADFLETVKNDEDLDKWATNATLDYYQPRLHKLVTEVTPIETIDIHKLNTKEDLEEFNKKYPLLLRIGAGTQQEQGKDDTTTKNVNGANSDFAYEFLTGGQVLNAIIPPTGWESVLVASKNVMGENEPKMGISVLEGDSGSPVYAYDKKNNKWKLLSMASGYIGSNDYYTLHKENFATSQRNEDNGSYIANNQSGKNFDWVANGSISTISSNGEQLNLPIYNEQAIHSLYARLSNIAQNTSLERVSNSAKATQGKIAPSQELADIKAKLNHGKNLRISGEKGTLNLKSDINQGAGALYFDTDFTVKGETENTTWLGAGVSVAKDKTVEWQIKNPENDRLSKIGEGTLLVNGTGENKGDISVGDGLVVLNQQDGKAFNKVGIVSGRPTVKLENSNQVNPDNIHFGYRGGRLDVNGNDLTFNYIKNVDDGARIVNNHENKTANIEIGHKIPTEKDIKIVPYGGQDKGDILLLVDNYLDTDGTFISFDKAVAIQYAIDKKIKAVENKAFAYNGSFGETNSNKTNGKLNVTYKPEVSGTTYLVSGGTNLNGNLTVEKGSLLLSGRPTPHAYDHINKIEPFKDNDWINRNFNATNIIANNDSVLTIGRNVQEVNANITANHTAKVQLGFVNGKTPVCVRSDYFGTTTCETNTYDDTVLKTIPTTQIKGDLILNDTAQVTLGNVHLTGKSTTNKDSNLTLTKDAKWTMTNDSTLGNLVMENGSEITLNKNYENNNASQFNTLTIQGNLSGQGKFNYLTNLTENKSDKIVVNGTASGTYVLKVKDKGTEPKKDDLVLLTANNRNNLNVTLENANDNNKNFVDWGTWRYELVDKNNQFVLAGKNTSSNNTNGNTDTNNTGGNTDTNNTGGNTDTNNTGGNTDTNNTGGNTDTNNTGGNTDTNNTGGNTDNNNTGGNTDTTNTGGNTNTNNTGGNTDTTNTGGNTDTNNTGGNTDTNNTGGNTDTTNTGGNTDTNNTGGNTNTNNTGGNNTMLTTEISKYTNLAISAQSAQIQNMLHTVENLQHRLWNDTPKLEGIWFTHDYMRQKNNTNYHRPYKNTYNIFQIGIDKNIVRERGRFLLGGAISYTDSSQDFDEGTGNGDLTMASIYGQYLSNKKYMMNFDVGYGVAKNKLKLDQKVSNHEQSVAHLGLGVGKTWRWDNTAIQPHLATHYHRFSGENYQLNGANVEQKATNLFSHQAGLKVAQTFNRPSGMNVMPYFSTTYTNVSGNAKIDFNNNRFVLPIEDYWQHKIGVDVQKGAWQGGANVGFIKDKNQTKDFSTGLNLSYRW